MHARVTRLEGVTQSLEDGKRMLEESIVPAAKALEGFVGGTWMGNAETGAVLGFTLWDTMEHLQASADAATKMRQEGAEQAGGTIASVEVYEVLVQV
jgi:hypothetical protein